MEDECFDNIIEEAEIRLRNLGNDCQEKATDE